VAVVEPPFQELVEQVDVDAAELGAEVAADWGERM
jgi:hypothetical protein